MDKLKTLIPEVGDLKVSVSSLSKMMTEDRPFKKTRTVPGSQSEQVDELLSMLVGNSLDLEDASKPSNIKQADPGAREKLATAATLKQLVIDVDTLKASTEDTSIRFGGLGFKNLHECTDWVRIHFEGMRYRLIVDPLLMFDKIFGNEHADSTAYMKMLESRLKLSIETGAEASALNALQFPRPRLFH